MAETNQKDRKFEMAVHAEAYEKVTQKSYHEAAGEQLKAFVANNQTAFRTMNNGMPFNITSGNFYGGVNALLLMSSGYEDPRWMTFDQANKAGLKIRKGEQATRILFPVYNEKVPQLDDRGSPVFESDGKPKMEIVQLQEPKAKLVPVFNAEQLEHMPVLAEKRPLSEPLPKTKELISAMGLEIVSTNNAADTGYSAAEDKILALAENMNDAQWLMRQAIAATGHEKRLNRDIKNPRGSNAAAREEAVTAIAGIFLGAATGMASTEQISPQTWTRHSDITDLYQVIRDASKAANYITRQNLPMLAQAQNQTHETNNTMGVFVHMETTDGRVRAYKHKTEEEFFTSCENLRNDSDNGKVIYEKTTVGQVLEKLGGQMPVGLRELKPETVIYKTDYEQPWRKDIDKDNYPYMMAVNKRGAYTAFLRSRPHIKNISTWGFSSDKKAFDALALFKKQESYNADKLQIILETVAPQLFWKQQTKQEGKEMYSNAASMEFTAQKEFAAVLRGIGCIVDGEHPVMDGESHRISVAGDRAGQKSGFYIGHLDGRPNGYVKNNRTSAESKWVKKGYALSAEEKAVRNAVREQKQKERDTSRERDYDEAADRITSLFKNSFVPVAGQSELKPSYLVSKSCQRLTGIYMDKEGQTLFIPATDANGKLWTMQYVDDQGTKLFAAGGKKTGNFHLLGVDPLKPDAVKDALDTASAIVIAEGYATAASIRQGLKALNAEAAGQKAAGQEVEPHYYNIGKVAVLAAFDSGNLKPVAEAIREKYPDKAIVIAGDDDRHLLNHPQIHKNIGTEKAWEAAKAVDARVVLPTFAPGEQESNLKAFTDFNDMHRGQMGLEGVKITIDAAVEKAVSIMRHKLRQKQDQAQEEQLAAGKDEKLEQVRERDPKEQTRGQVMIGTVPQHGYEKQREQLRRKEKGHSIAM